MYMPCNNYSINFMFYCATVALELCKTTSSQPACVMLLDFVQHLIKSSPIMFMRPSKEYGDIEKGCIGNCLTSLIIVVIDILVFYLV